MNMRACSRINQKAARAAVQSLLFMPMIATVALGGVPTDWPPPGAGNNTLKNAETTPQSNWSSSQEGCWDEAMSIVDGYNPAMGAEIDSHLSDGSVNVVDIKNSEPTDENPGLYGK